MTALENTNSLKSLAVLIDADNASPKIVSGLLARRMPDCQRWFSLVRYPARVLAVAHDEADVHGH
jgi:hypothetical protein